MQGGFARGQNSFVTRAIASCSLRLAQCMASINNRFCGLYVSFVA
ncbi:hypothetical protein Rcae01_05756 [Novipirellula caenicola]|uniref:Uncharacterized protein n=1 Tax=Novipirellula caenicola TaxID=1536901 RepID=A0ABP9W0D5_9BACT